MNAISKETFTSLNTDSKLNVLFDYVIELHKCASESESRTTRMEGKFYMVAAVFGVLGAVIVAIGKWLIGK